MRAERHFQAGQYREALEVFEAMQTAGCDMCPLRVYKAQCFVKLEDVDSAIREVDQGLSEVDSQSDLSRQKQLYKELILNKIELLKTKGAGADYRTTLHDIQRNPYSKKLREWADEEAQSLETTDLAEVQERLGSNEEYKAFSACFEGQAKEGDLWHVVATEWVRKWLASLQGAVPPGPISNLPILEKLTAKFLPDPDPSKAYTNVKVRAGLLEQDDFMVVPKAAYHQLVTKYSHDQTEIRRYSVATNVDGSSSSVEIWLKKVHILVDDTVRAIFISRKETVTDLKEKLLRCLAIDLSIRLWRKKTNEMLPNVVDILQRIRAADESYVFREASLVDDSKELENADIADEDLLIVEKQSRTRRWLLLPEHAETCSACGRPGKLLVCTGCRTAKYCSANCQRQHFQMHKDVCKRRQKKGRQGLVGLQNLGNTCFMNSAIQCLSHTEPLTMYLLEDKHKAEINTKNPIGTGGRLVSAYVSLLQTLWLETDPVQSPWELKRTISTFAPQFSGYQQHDSHELLSYLLDGIHEDLNRVKKKPYTTLSELPGRSDDEIAGEFWNNHLKRNRSIVVDLMHGQYKSTLLCPQCGKVSITFDPFLTYTLQIPNRETKRFNLIFVPLDVHQSIKDLQCILPLTTNILEVKRLISEEFSTKVDNLMVIALEHKKFKGVANADTELNDLRFYEVVIYETPEESMQPVCLNITEKGWNDTLKPACCPRILFFRKEDTTVSIRRAASGIAEWLLGVGSQQFSVRLVNRAKVKTSYFMFQVKEVCAFCDSKECFNCEIPSDPEMRLDDLLLRAKDRLELELRCETAVPKATIEEKTHKSVQAAVNTKQHISLEDCLQYSSRPEVLSKDNAWFCSVCKADVQATKTLQMYKSPEVLIMHLKRFRPRFYEKLSTTIEFPIDAFDLSPYLIGPERDRQVYDLYAVSNHFGSVMGGHYTAFVRAAGRWFDMDDSSVTEMRTMADIVTPAAYMLFYRRRK